MQGQHQNERLIQKILSPIHFFESAFHFSESAIRFSCFKGLVFTYLLQWCEQGLFGVFQHFCIKEKDRFLCYVVASVAYTFYFADYVMKV